MSGGANPCGECQLAISDCPWLSSRGRTPVPGWVAEPTSILCDKRNVPTFHILQCPLYISPHRAAIPKSKNQQTEYTGFCALCGAPLTGRQRKYCKDCQAKYGNRFIGDYAAQRKMKHEQV